MEKFLDKKLEQYKKLKISYQGFKTRILLRFTKIKQEYLGVSSAKDVLSEEEKKI